MGIYIAIIFGYKKKSHYRSSEVCIRVTYLPGGAIGAPLDMSPSAAGGRCSEGAVCAAVDKSKERRKPEDLIG